MAVPDRGVGPSIGARGRVEGVGARVGAASGLRAASGCAWSGRSAGVPVGAPVGSGAGSPEVRGMGGKAGLAPPVAAPGRSVGGVMPPGATAPWPQPRPGAPSRAVARPSAAAPARLTCGASAARPTATATTAPAAGSRGRSAGRAATARPGRGAGGATRPGRAARTRGAQGARAGGARGPRGTGRGTRPGRSARARAGARGLDIGRGEARGGPAAGIRRGRAGQRGRAGRATGRTGRGSQGLCAALARGEEKPSTEAGAEQRHTGRDDVLHLTCPVPGPDHGPAGAWEKNPSAGARLLPRP